MKKLNLLSVFITGMALLVASSGCHRKPTSLNPIPGINGPSMPQNTGPSSGTSINTEPATTANPSGTPEGYGSYNNLLNGPHNEDREKFAADIVYFDFDRANIKASEESKLQDVANFFKANASGSALIIEGNCDERGTEKYNLSLGERRALAAREYLINLGVDAQRIKTVTYGASKPAEPGHDEAAWKKNRRDEMVLITPK